MMQTHRRESCQLCPQSLFLNCPTSKAYRYAFLPRMCSVLTPTATAKCTPLPPLPLF